MLIIWERHPQELEMYARCWIRHDFHMLWHKCVNLWLMLCYMHVQKQTFDLMHICVSLSLSLSFSRSLPVYRCIVGRCVGRSPMGLRVLTWHLPPVNSKQYIYTHKKRKLVFLHMHGPHRPDQTWWSFLTHCVGWGSTLQCSAVCCSVACMWPAGIRAAHTPVPCATMWMYPHPCTEKVVKNIKLSWKLSCKKHKTNHLYTVISQCALKPFSPKPAMCAFSALHPATHGALCAQCALVYGAR